MRNKRDVVVFWLLVVSMKSTRITCRRKHRMLVHEKWNAWPMLVIGLHRGVCVEKCPLYPSLDFSKDNMKKKNLVKFFEVNNDFHKIRIADTAPCIVIMSDDLQRFKRDSSSACWNTGVEEPKYFCYITTQDLNLIGFWSSGLSQIFIPVLLKRASSIRSGWEKSIEEYTDTSQFFWSYVILNLTRWKMLRSSFTPFEDWSAFSCLYVCPS